MKDGWKKSPLVNPENAISLLHVYGFKDPEEVKKTYNKTIEKPRIKK